MLHILIRDYAAQKDAHVLLTVSLEHLHHPWNDSHMGARKDRQADRIDVLKQSGYPEVVINWSMGLAPTAARKYADLPAIILSRKLKREGLRIENRIGIYPFFSR